MELQYGIKSIEETEYRYNYDFDYSNLCPTGDLPIQLGHELTANASRKEISVTLTVEIHDRETSTLLMRNVTRSTFSVEPFDEFYKGNTDNGLEVTAPQLMNTFISVAIGTARGFLAKNLKGTPLQGLILPLIPESDFIIQSKTTKK